MIHRASLRRLYSEHASSVHERWNSEESNWDFDNIVFAKEVVTPGTRVKL